MPQSAQDNAADFSDRSNDLFFNISQNLMGIMTLDGYFQRLNPSWENLLGWRLAELTDHAWLDKVHPSDRAPTLAAICQLQEQPPGTSCRFETRFRHHNGHYCQLAWNAAIPAPTATSPEPKQVYISAIDMTVHTLNQQLTGKISEHQQTEAAIRVTQIQWEWQYKKQADALKSVVARLETEIAERKQIAGALAASEARIKGIAANIPGAIFQFCYRGDKWTIDYISEGIQGIMGVTAEDIIQDMMVFVRRLHPEDFRSYIASVSEAVEHLMPWHYEGRLVKPDGQVCWWQGDATPTQAEDGGIMFCGVVLDISDRKQAEAALQQANAALESKVAERTVELIKLIQQLEHDNQERKLTETLLQQSLKELQQTQSKLIHSEKMSSLGQLVAGVAHEINNPVNFIYGNLSYANAYIQDLLDLVRLYQIHYPSLNIALRNKIGAMDLEFMVEDLPKLLASMKVGADRIRDIVQSLRTFSRLDEADFKAVDLHASIDSTLMLLQNRLESKVDQLGIRIRKEYGDLPVVECYAGQLNQVFMNILINAIDALEEFRLLRPSSFAVNHQSPAEYSTQTTRQPPQITIQTAVTSSNHVAIRIADNGQGIAPGVLDRLFDPFFTTKPIGKGTGLGLSISHQIVTEQHNGSLRCSSEPGEGTEFVIEIPTRHPIR